MSSTSLKLPTDLIEEIDALAERTDRSRVGMIRVLLRDGSRRLREHLDLREGGVAVRPYDDATPMIHSAQ